MKNDRAHKAFGFFIPGLDKEVDMASDLMKAMFAGTGKVSPKTREVTGEVMRLLACVRWIGRTNCLMFSGFSRHALLRAIHSVADKMQYVNFGGFCLAKRYFTAESCHWLWIFCTPEPYCGADWPLHSAFRAHPHLIAEQIGRLATMNMLFPYPIMAGRLAGPRGEAKQAKIFSIASGGLIAASILIRPPQRGQASTSNSNTRFKSSAHG
jgi:hypothetical protein